ncbi:MAG: hypothetical protein NVS9B1_06040 [Candidatus Dormibacteraceae bacterium]
MPRKPAAPPSAEQILKETQELVSRLVRENRTLKARTLKLGAELDRVTRGWEAIKRLAREAPRLRPK